MIAHHKLAAATGALDATLARARPVRLSPGVAVVPVEARRRVGLLRVLVRLRRVRRQVGEAGHARADADAALVHPRRGAVAVHGLVARHPGRVARADEGAGHAGQVGRQVSCGVAFFGYLGAGGGRGAAAACF